MPVTLTPWPKDWESHLPSTDDPSLVCQAEWGLLIPAVHRALANPSETVEFPKLRHDRSDPAHAYWEAAYYLLNLLLGWSDPGLGLSRLRRESPSEPDDPRLALLLDVWSGDDDFCLFEAWCWDQRPGRDPRDFSDPSWLAQGAARHAFYEKNKGQPPLGGGYNPLHLGHHARSGALAPGPSPTSIFLNTDPQAARAVLVLDQAPGWYRLLEDHGATLPDLGERSWHVEVFVKPLGWLGTFRRSRVTGAWFQGKHSTHLLGQDPS